MNRAAIPAAGWLDTGRQFLRYAATGGLASVANVGVYWVLAAKAGMNPNLAWTLGYLAAVAIGYVVHSRWSFRGHGERHGLVRTGGKFFAVSLVSYGLNSFWVWLLVERLNLATWTPIPPAVFVTPVVVFVLNRQWVFK